MVEHAIRIIVKHTRQEYLYPASHYASVPSTNGSQCFPRWGKRLRLKAGFCDSVELDQGGEGGVCWRSKKYGAIVADNGNFFLDLRGA